VGLLVLLANSSMFFFNEELIIAFALIVFISIVVSLLRKVFLKAFFSEVKFIYVSFSFLFNINIKLISIVKRVVNFLIVKNRYLYGDFLYALVSSYNSYLSIQKLYLINIVDSFAADILKTFFVNLLKIRRFKLDVRLLDSISAFYYRLNFEQKTFNYYKYIC